MDTDTTSESDDLVSPLDLLLTNAATGVAGRLIPNTSWSKFVLNLAKRPGVVAHRASALGRALVSIAEGRSGQAPTKGDKRFADPAWQSNPLLRRIMQAYLAATDTANALFSDADLDWRDAERMRFVLDVIIDGLAPTNIPLVNPLGWRAVIDTGGLSVPRGLRNLVADMAAPPRVPSMVQPDAFIVGETVATTSGAVVFRTDVFELIQYRPLANEVWQEPVLMVPPVINKFYIMDIAPGRSLVEYCLQQGHQMFAISWRNPTAAHRHWGFDTYGQSIIDALDAIQDITASDRVHVQASCSGGILAAMTAAHLTATGRQERLASLTLMVTVLDSTQAGLPAAALNEDTANTAVAVSARKGYLDGRNLAEVFAWLRPDDLIWRYWVNNYIEGRPPPPFDVLFWNADTTRMAAALHRDMVMMGLDNALTKPGAITMLGTPVDLRTVKTSAYVVAGIADHISPWQACYRSARLLDSTELRFVLSSSGHIAALVNPPGNRRASYHVGVVDDRDPAQWVNSAERQSDSWWPNYTTWLAEHSGQRRPAGFELGSSRFPALEPAPGVYVLEG
jgi:polyhydroxyalkanoate synthase